MEADVIVRAKVVISNDSFDPQTLAEEIVKRGLPPDVEVRHVLVIANNVPVGEADNR